MTPAAARERQSPGAQQRYGDGRDSDRRERHGGWRRRGHWGAVR